MPLPKRQTAAKPRAKDDRFANFETDPKFRLPSKKRAKTKLDPRFSRLRTDPDFQNKAPVDRYGRKITKQEVKKNLSRLHGSDAEESEQEEELTPEHVQRRDKAVRKELAKVQARGLDPIRDGGLESSSDESSDNEEEEAEVEDQAELAPDGNEVPTGEVTARLAAVNMDWDNIRATDIMAVANSFLPADGRIHNVTIYPSEFGLERLQREELEGPPREIFTAATSANKDIANVDHPEEADSEDDDQSSDDLEQEEGEDFNSKALRTYQLDRLRYYYAVIECSSPNAAKSIYDNLDGREYLSSSNFFDLRFVPDEIDFDAEPHDHCEYLPKGYKPNEFITGALSHSKVKLTWDADDTTRKEAQKRAFTRKEVDENELQAYLGNASSSSEDEAETSKADKAASLRAALGLGTSGKSSQSKTRSSSKRDRDFEKPDGEMEVTFTSGLSTGTKGSVFENEPEENTLEKYVRKQKERKEKRKERYKAVREGRDPDAIPAAKETAATTAAQEDDDPFNDPFFASDPETEKALDRKSKKAQRAKKREEREKADQDAAAERANLELLMVDDDRGSKVRHFDMNEVLKAEKAKKIKKGGKKGKNGAAVVEDDFKMDTEDPRFAKLYESHEFAIDPTNPRFKGTKGMKALLEEGRKKRKRDLDVDGEGEVKKTKKKNLGDANGGAEDSLSKLAARVKAKSKKH